MELPEKRNIFTPNVILNSILKIISEYEFYYVTSLSIDYSSDED